MKKTAKNSRSRILGDGVTRRNDTRITQLNSNDLIIGPTGAGKTRSYVIPNLLHNSDESLVIVDTKGTLRKTYGPYLASRGFHVADLDFVDCVHSTYGYDPLHFIELDEKTGRYCEQDVLRVAHCLCPITSTREPYWEQAAQVYLCALIGLVLERFAKEDRNISTVCALAERLGDQWLTDLFRDVDDCNPTSFAVREYRYAMAPKRADKMIDSVRGILVTALQPLSFDGATHLARSKNMVDVARMGHEKSALFITISDTDRSLDRLTNAFYTQALQALVREADRQPEGALPVPVRLIFDDFATNTVIPDFDKVITTIRSRNIAVSLIVQDLSQLESLYKPSKATTIANNCDTWLYLGGQDLKTLMDIATKMDRPAAYVLGLCIDEAILFVRGDEPRFIDKYRLEEDPTYMDLMMGEGLELECQI